MSFRTALLAAIVAISAVSTVQSTSAQNYPAKPIHLIVPYPAGGGTDFFARLVGQKMSEFIGQPFVVENKPGAATNLGADFVAKAPPDGYTMLLGDVATYAANPSLYKKLPFDPAKDFAPVTLTARFLSVLVTNPNKLKVNSVVELIDQAKKGAGQDRYRARWCRQSVPSRCRAVPASGWHQTQRGAVSRRGPRYSGPARRRRAYDVRGLCHRALAYRGRHPEGPGSCGANPAAGAPRCSAGRGRTRACWLRGLALAGLCGAGEDARSHHHQAARHLCCGRRGPGRAPEGN